MRNQGGNRITISSGGGDITIRGRSGVEDSEADGFGSQRLLVIDSGTGTIEIVGDQVSASGGFGLRFGGLNYYPDVAITSASIQEPAIRLVGASVNRTGIGIGEGNTNSAQAGTILVQSTAATGGGITLEGSSSQSSSGSRGIALWGDETDGFQKYQFLSNNGSIQFLSLIDSASSEIGFWSDTYLGQRKLYANPRSDSHCWIKQYIEHF